MADTNITKVVGEWSCEIIERLTTIHGGDESKVWKTISMSEFLAPALLKRYPNKPWDAWELMHLK